MKLILAVGSACSAMALGGCGLFLDSHGDDASQGELDAFEPIDASERRDAGDAGDASRSRDAGIDASDAFVTGDIDAAVDAAAGPGMDAAVDSGVDPAMHDAGVDGGADGGMDASTNIDAYDASDAYDANDVGSDAGHDTGPFRGDANPDAAGDAAPTYGISFPASNADIDVSSDGNSVVVASATEGVRYFRWNAVAGWMSPAITVDRSSVAVILDDPNPPAVYALDPGFRTWLPPGMPQPRTAMFTPTRMAATAGVVAMSPSSVLPGGPPTAPIRIASPPMWATGLAQRTIGLGCALWTMSPGAEIRALAVLPAGDSSCGPRVAATVQETPSSRRRVELWRDPIFDLDTPVTDPPSCYSEHTWPAIDFGNDLALLDVGTETLLAATTSQGPAVFLGSYFMPPRPMAPAATSVALGLGSGTNVLLAWTDGGRALLQSLPRLPPPFPRIPEALCTRPVARSVEIGILTGATKVRISDCNAGFVTAVVRNATHVEIVRMPCPAPVEVTVGALAP